MGTEISLGDVVTYTDNPDRAYQTCTVKKINDDGTVRLFRPYTHTADFSYTGGVICYVGVEEFDCNPANLRVLEKARPLR